LWDTDEKGFMIGFSTTYLVWQPQRRSFSTSQRRNHPMTSSLPRMETGSRAPLAVVNNLRWTPVVTSVHQKIKTNGSAEKLLIGHDCRTSQRKSGARGRVWIVTDRYARIYPLTTPTSRQAPLVHQKFQLQKFQEKNRRSRERLLSIFEILYCSKKVVEFWLWMTVRNRLLCARMPHFPIQNSRRNGC
jgi:hypothetical protein